MLHKSESIDMSSKRKFLLLYINGIRSILYFSLRNGVYHDGFVVQ